MSAKPLPAYAATLLLLCSVMIGCATPSPPPLPVVAPRPTIPSLPAVAEPMPSGAYWARHCKLMSDAASTLKTSLPGSERCATGGPGVATRP